MSTFSLPTGTITFLFTDIEGSTKLWETHAEQMQEALAQHDALIRRAVENAGGVVFKTVGDAFCAAFAAAPDALTAAAAAQRRLFAEPWPDQTPLRVRMALHTGLAQERDNDYFGPVLNRVARLLSAGHGGQTLVSAASYELVRDALPEGVHLVDIGLHRLKDLERPERIFQVDQTGLPDAFAPLKTLDLTPNNLHQQLTSFIGREKAIKDVTALLGNTRLLTLTGAGGSGKTRLSLQVAADVLDRYEEGAWQVELAPLADPALVAQAVASVLKVKQAGQTLTQTLVEQLKDKHLLLVLDNCEHVVTACAQLTAALIRSCPRVTVLATSREPLGITGEQTYRVPSLSLPTAKQARAATVENLSQFEAVRLFIERALLVRADFAVTNTNAPALAQLCFRLDGIPLAIELAAARLRSLGIEQISDKLDARFRFLTGGDKAALPRQQTLRALVDWSYDLLTEPEKVLLARLSVFAGGWTLEAAETTCGFDPLEDWEVLDLLTSLVDKSLALAEEEGSGSNGAATRYRLLETLREYAQEKQALAGETSLIDRHARWCLAVAEEAARNLTGATQAASFRQLETEHDNLRFVLSRQGLEASQDGQAREIYIRLAAALWSFWHASGYLTEGREHLTHAYQLLAFSLPESADTATEDDREKARLLSRLLRGLGNITQTQGDYDTAEPFYQEGLSVSYFLGDEHGVAVMMGALGNIAWDRNDYDRAATLYEQALDVFRRLGNPTSTAWALNSLANVVSHRGDFAAALRLYGESLTIYREKADRYNMAWALGNIGSLYYDQGDYTAAYAPYQEGLRIARELQIKPRIAVILSGLGSLALIASDVRQAVILWAATQALRDSIGAVVPAVDRERINERLAQARLEMGDAAFMSAWDEGHALSWEQAVKRALRE